MRSALAAWVPRPRPSPRPRSRRARHWLTQSSIDWFWAFAGLSGPVIALLGSAAAPGSLALSTLGPVVTRLGVAVAAIVAAIAIPTFAADRLTVNAAKSWRDDVDGAYRALDAASDLDPLSDLPDLVKAEIARQTGDVSLALASLLKPRERSPTSSRTTSSAPSCSRNPILLAR